MGAARFVGRVGGLAVALGVGAGIFSGNGVAWADRGADGGSSPSADKDSSQSSAPARVRRGPAASAGGQQAGHDSAVPETAAAANNDPAPTADLAPVADPEPTSTVRRIAAPPAAAETVTDPGATPLIEPVAAPQAEAAVEPPVGTIESPVAVHDVQTIVDPVVNLKVELGPIQYSAPEAAAAGDLSAVDTTGANPADGAGTDPSGPDGSALVDAVLAFAIRRDLVGASATDTPAALATTSAVTKNGVTVDPTVYFYDGILQGNLNATSAGGNTLTYKFVDSSNGGKITIGNVPAPLPGSGAQSFTLLPYATWIDPANPKPNPTPTGTQTFNVRVSEVTPFDTVIVNIPLVGMIAAPVIDLMQATPFVGDLLAPIIGGSVVAEISADVGALVPAGKPVAYTYKVNSFDGTPISMNFFPASQGSLLPGNYQATIFNGPGLGAPGSTDPYAAYQAAGSTPGVGLMRGQGLPAPYDNGFGFNVITWDPRGEFDSGGVLQLDNPMYEGRDVSSLIDWAVANTPLLQENGSPSIGMAGGSYGGGIQMTTVDPRIKAIVPAIAWNSLNESLYPDDVFKTAWANALALALVSTGARINDQIPLGILTGNLFGWLSPSAQAVLASSGPTALLTKLDAATMFVQGTVDALFPLAEAVTNAQTMLEQNPYIAANPELVKMIWFCGGHGVCLDPVNQTAQATSIFTQNMIWLNKYVKDYLSPFIPVDQFVPTFQWWDQAGTHYASPLMPFAPGFESGAVTAESTGGQLGILPWAWLGSGPEMENCTVAAACEFPLNNTFATKAKSSLDVPITVAKKDTKIVGAPTVSFEYSGWGTSKAVYAQVVDNATGRVLGNIVTPIPVTLDGKSHTVTADIADIAYTAPADGSSLTLQIVGGATLYMNGAIGGVTISNIKVDLPTTTAAVPV